MRSATVSGRKEKVPAPKDNLVLIGGKEQNRTSTRIIPAVAQNCLGGNDR